MLPGVTMKANKRVLDVPKTYMFWNGHEPTRRVVSILINPMYTVSGL